MTENVLKLCSHCNKEGEMQWDVEKDGYRAFCPYCGKFLMLCDASLHLSGEDDSFCDYNGYTDSCKYDVKGKQKTKQLKGISNGTV